MRLPKKSLLPLKKGGFSGEFELKSLSISLYERENLGEENTFSALSL
jgi:hypothetical protein